MNASEGVAGISTSLPEPDCPRLVPEGGKGLAAYNPLEPTIFHEPWWLDIATRGAWKAAEVTNAGRTIGRLPYTLHKRFGLRSIEMPMLTHFLGPGFVDCEGSTNNVFLKKLSITRELIHKLPAASLTRIKLHRGITDAIAFQEQAFRTSVQFTHEIGPLPETALWANMRNKTRNVIRRAQEQTLVRHMSDAGEFVNFYARNLKARKVRSNLDEAVCRKLIECSIERRRGHIIGAYDEAGELLAANFYIWDRSFYYFLLTTRTLNSGNGTTSLLLWEALKDASKKGLTFDSDGLNSNGGILFLAGLGGTIKPRYIVTKSKVTGQILEGLLDAVWGRNYFVRG